MTTGLPAGPARSACSFILPSGHRLQQHRGQLWRFVLTQRFDFTRRVSVLGDEALRIAQPVGPEAAFRGVDHEEIVADGRRHAGLPGPEAEVEIVEVPAVESGFVERQREGRLSPAGEEQAVERQRCGRLCSSLGVIGALPGLGRFRIKGVNARSDCAGLVGLLHWRGRTPPTEELLQHAVTRVKR